MRLLEAHAFTVVAAVDNEADLRRALLEDEFDVAVVDVRLPPGQTDEGLRVALEARQRRPGLPVLVLSQYVEQLYARELLAAGDGAVGYLLKERVMDVGEFVGAVRQVAGGGTVMDPEVVARLLAAQDRAAGPLGRLSPRETDVLGLMAAGRSNQAIASELVVSEKAVSKHIASIFLKLDLWPDEDDNRRVRAVLAYLRDAS